MTGDSVSALERIAGSERLVTVVTQDAVTGAVLMVAHMDAAAAARTLETGEMHYHSRTRGLWHKGATSGNVQRLVSAALDCDGDALLVRVRPAGPACHTGAVSCFAGATGDMLTSLDATIAERATSGETTAPSYTRALLGDRNRRLKKIAEESGELLVACADGDRPAAAREAADLIYHMLVALHATSVTLDDVRRVLHDRAETTD